MTVYGKDLVLLAQVVDRLILKAGYTQSTCFACDFEVPDVLPSSSPICTVCLGDENYDEATFMGAGPNALAVYGTIIVTLINQCLLDSVPKQSDALLHHMKGLLPLKRSIIRALLKTDGPEWWCEGHVDQWVPEIEGEHYLIERGLIPRGWSRPRYADKGGRIFLVTSLHLSFGLDEEL